MFFRASSFTTALEVITQIGTNFHATVFTQLLAGYKGVSFLMLLGYLLHFLPDKLETGATRMVVRMPLVLQALLIVAVIYIVIQVKTAGIQPFIYFQF